MLSSKRCSAWRKPLKCCVCASIALSALTLSSAARSQESVQGFAIERLTPAAAGAGWLVMDSLDMKPGLGAAASVTTGYGRNPLRLTAPDGSHLAVASKQAFADLGAAVTYNRFRFYANITNPLILYGKNGRVGAYDYTAPSVNIPGHPDLLPDMRLGIDVRILGQAKSAFRFGASAQLIVPSGDTEDYLTDGTYRGVVRALFAGDSGGFAYAGHLGAHIRPRNDHDVPGSPQGSELLFGLAAGPRVPLAWPGTALVMGPEVFGQSAFRSIFEKDTTGLEALLSARVELLRDGQQELHIKMGSGGGINAHFGTPEWRAVFGIEISDSGWSEGKVPRKSARR